MKKQHLDRLLSIAQTFSPKEEIVQTVIPFLSIRRSMRPIPIMPITVTPSFCLILQGEKRLNFDKESVIYGPGTYIASMIYRPASAGISKASKSVPYVGLKIDLTKKEIASVILEAGIETKRSGSSVKGFFGRPDAASSDVFVRLLELLERPKDVPFLAPLLKREMIFRLLTGADGHHFMQQALVDQASDGVEKVIEWIKDNYTERFTVEELARSNHMSVSGLHHKFKVVVAMGPLQYQKQLRLQEARRLMLSGANDATTAAFTVGYESASQFSREYRRQFGLPPLQDVRAMQGR